MTIKIWFSSYFKTQLNPLCPSATLEVSQEGRGRAKSILFLLWTVASPLSWASPAPSQTGGVEASHSQAALSPLLLHEAPVLCSGKWTPPDPRTPSWQLLGPGAYLGRPLFLYSLPSLSAWALAPGRRGPADAALLLAPPAAGIRGSWWCW